MTTLILFFVQILVGSFFFFVFTLISVFVDENNGHVNRLLGFSVYVSNTTIKEDGCICFYDNDFYTPSTIPEMPTLNCKMHGRYVIFYNERKQGQPPYYSSEAFVDLCEFEVYGTHQIFIEYFLYALLQRVLKIMSYICTNI